MKGFLKNTFIIIAIAGILFFLSLRVIVRNTNWNNNFSLCSHDIRDNKDSAQLHTYLASVFLSEDKVEEAQVQLIEASRLFPSSISFTNLGGIYMMQHKGNEAENAFKKALEYGDYYPAYHYYAILIYTNQGPKAAESFITKALDKFPDSFSLWTYLALTKYHLGDKDNALIAAQKAYSLHPNPETQDLLNGIENNEPVNTSK